MKKILFNLYAILEQRQKKRLLLFFIVLVSYALAESFGLAMILPLLDIVSNPEQTIENEYIKGLFNQFELPISGRESVYWLLSIFASLYVIKTSLQIFVFWLTANIPYEFLYHISERLYTKYSFLDWEKYMDINSNTVIKNITKSSEITAYAYVTLMEFLTAIVTTLILSTLLLLFSPILTLSVFLIFGAISYSLILFIRPIQIQAGKDREVALDGLYRAASESVLGMQEMRVFRSSNFFRFIYLNHAKGVSDSFKKILFYPPIPIAIIELSAVIILMIIIGYITFDGQNFSTLIPTIVFLVAIARRLLPSISQITACFVKLRNLEESVDIIFNEINDIKVNIEESSKEIEIFNREWESLHFKKIKFSYKNSKEISTYDIDIIRNLRTAIIGPSGSGKTTFLYLLLGLLKPGSGSIEIDQVTERDISILNSEIGFVPQSPYIIDNTILNNITFGRPLDREKINKAVSISHLEDVIKSSSDGLETLIGEQGIKLSGGQRQRISIARALYSDPDIIIFDEATSSLDNISEKIIQSTISDLIGNKTIITVAHRLSTIQDYDTIYLLNNGKVEDKGTHDELILRNDLYKEMNNVL